MRVIRDRPRSVDPDGLLAGRRRSRPVSYELHAQTGESPAPVHLLELDITLVPVHWLELEESRSQAAEIFGNPNETSMCFSVTVQAEEYALVEFGPETPTAPQVAASEVEAL
jgi:hypothetical protein